MSSLNKMKNILMENDNFFNDDKDETINNKIEYVTIKNGYITKEQAIAIAACDRNLKDSLFHKAKKKNIYLGWISFEAFDVGLVQIYSDFAWHVKVKSGSYGGCKEKRILGIKYEDYLFDGEFDEDNNISCIVMCDSGEYIFSEELDINEIKAPNMVKYEEYIKISSIYHK